MLPKARLLNAINEQKASLLAGERTVRENAEAIDVTLPGRSRPHGRLHPADNHDAGHKARDDWSWLYLCGRPGY